MSNKMSHEETIMAALESASDSMSRRIDDEERMAVQAEIQSALSALAAMREEREKMRAALIETRDEIRLYLKPGEKNTLLCDIMERCEDVIGEPAAVPVREADLSRPLFAETAETLVARGTPGARRELRLRGFPGGPA